LGEDSTPPGGGESSQAAAPPAKDPADHELAPREGPDPPEEGQETAELDMRVVLDGEKRAPDPGSHAAPVGPVGAVPQSSSPTEHPGEDSFEWELPRGSSTGSATHAEAPEQPDDEVIDDRARAPGQDHLWSERSPQRETGLDR
jgi:hypothetical protein